MPRGARFAAQMWLSLLLERCAGIVQLWHAVWQARHQRQATAAQLRAWHHIARARHHARRCGL